MCQQSQHEHSIFTQIPVHKQFRFSLLVGVGLETFDERQVLLDVMSLRWQVGDPYDPHKQRQRSQNTDEDQPEPNEQEDLLIEEVDRKDTLDVVIMNGSEPTNFEVAHGDAWKHH